MSTQAPGRGSNADAPLFRQVERMLTEDLAAGRLAPGDRLASERSLSQRLGVSRVTVRRALLELAARERIAPAPRQGWHVTTERRPEVALRAFPDWAPAGVLPTARALVRPASPDEREDLGLAADARVVEVERVCRRGDDVLLVGHLVLAEALAPDLGALDLGARPLADLLVERYGRLPARAESTVSSGLADDAEARLLAVPPGAPVFRVRELLFDGEGRPLQRHVTVARRAGYRLTTALTPVS